MKVRSFPTLVFLTAFCGGAGAGSDLSGQALSSKNFFISSVEMANGGTCFSVSYSNVLALGAGVVPSRLSSSNFRIPGGYAATLDVATGGRPWITHVSPSYVTTNGLQNLTIHGINLDQGTTPTVMVGGKTGAFVNRTSERIIATQPALTTPGFPTVSVTNSLGSSGLARSVGVLPLLETDPAPAPNTQFDIVFRGTRGDSVIWAIGALPSVPIPLPPLLHGLQLNPAAMLLLPGLPITSADGVFRYSSPPTNYLGPIYVQAAFVSSNPGYAPGSFTNVIQL